MQDPKHVAVLGGGIMGAGIAGFFADRGCTVTVYDMTLELARGSLDRLTDPKAKIPLILSPKHVERIRPLPVSAMREELRAADLVIEAVPEIMAIKQKAFADVDRFRRAGSIVATNTSGLSLDEMVSGLSRDLREHFLGIHFFNPVRYMALVEVVPGSATRPEVSGWAAGLFVKLGKKPIIARDTPNFVANRVGIYVLMRTMALARKYGLEVEDVDMITGEALGRPKMATFRLCDMVGIDTVLHASLNSHENCPRDEERALFSPPDLVRKMVDGGLLGEKTGKGFYQKVKKDRTKGGDDKPDLLVLDLDTLCYRPRKQARADCVRVAKTFSKAGDRIRSMVTFDDRDPVSLFARELVLGTAAYALRRVGEISRDSVTIDNAMKWGFAHELGPIELLDAIGLDRSMRMMDDLGIPVPAALVERAASGRPFSPPPAPPPAREIRLSHAKRCGRTVRENLSARLVDLGDGVLCCEFDAKMVPTMNPVDEHVLSMMMQAHDVVHSGRFSALVISNQAAHFCAGAQLQLILDRARSKRFDYIREQTRRFQRVNTMNLHADFPVVVAPHGMTLGGGLEVSLAGHVRVAYAELYAGLVEVGVGVVPAGGGCLLLLRHLIERDRASNPGPMPPVMAAAELIGFGKVSSSAFDAREKGFLLPDDVIVFSKDEQIRVAKEVALARLESFAPIPPFTLTLPGPGGLLVIEDALEGFMRQGKLTHHGLKIARIQARILTGGPAAGPVSPVSEQTILDLEAEGFVELCAEKATQERMAFMLKNGKPLIN